MERVQEFITSIQKILFPKIMPIFDEDSMPFPFGRQNVLIIFGANKIIFSWEHERMSQSNKKKAPMNHDNILNFIMLFRETKRMHRY